MGEIVGAELYVTETTKPPVQYTYVGVINIAAQLGGIMALAFGILSITYLFNWRYAFWGGSIIALVGFIARTNLRESTEFTDAKRRIKNTLENFGINSKELSLKKYTEEKITLKTILAYFLSLSYILCKLLRKQIKNYCKITT